MRDSFYLTAAKKGDFVSMMTENKSITKWVLRPTRSPGVPLPFAARSCGLFTKPGNFRQDGGRRDFLELFWLCTGVLEVNPQLTLRAGEVGFLFPGDEHAYRVKSEQASWCFVTFDGKLPLLLDSYALKRGPYHAGECPVPLFEKLFAELRQPGPRSEFIAAATAIQLLHFALCGAPPEVEPTMVHQFKELVRQNYSDRGISIEGLADALGVHRGSLHKKFTEATGLTPQEYLANLRLQKAIELLGNSQLSVNEIAARCGFRSGNYFAKVFRRRMGRRPSEFRHCLG